MGHTSIQPAVGVAPAPPSAETLPGALRAAGRSRDAEINQRLQQDVIDCMEAAFDAADALDDEARAAAQRAWRLPPAEAQEARAASEARFREGLKAVRAGFHASMVSLDGARAALDRVQERRDRAMYAQTRGILRAQEIKAALDREAQELAAGSELAALERVAQSPCAMLQQDIPQRIRNEAGLNQPSRPNIQSGDFPMFNVRSADRPTFADRYRERVAKRPIETDGRLTRIQDRVEARRTQRLASRQEWKPQRLMGPVGALDPPAGSRSEPLRLSQSAQKIEQKRVDALESMVVAVEVAAGKIDETADQLLYCMINGFEQYSAMQDRLVGGVQKIGELQDAYLDELIHAIHGAQAHPEDLDRAFEQSDRVMLAVSRHGQANADQVDAQAATLQRMLGYQSETFDAVFESVVASGRAVLETYKGALGLLDQQAAEALSRAIAVLEKNMEADRQKFEQHVKSRELTIHENNEGHRREMEAREKANTEYMSRSKAALDELNAHARNSLEHLKEVHRESHSQRVDSLELTKETNRADAEYWKNRSVSIFGLVTRVIFPLAHF